MKNNGFVIDLLGHRVKLVFDCPPWEVEVEHCENSADHELLLTISADGQEEEVSFSLDDNSFLLCGPTGSAAVDLTAKKGEVKALASLKEVHLDNVLRHLANLFIRQEGGTLLHGTALVVEGEAHVFAGPSGAGKSTLAQLASDLPLVSDEFVFVKDGPAVVVSPPFGHAQRCAGLPKLIPLASVSLLVQGSQERWVDMPRSVVLARLTQNPVAGANPLLETERLAKLLKGVELRCLTFRKSEQVASFITSTLAERKRKRFLGAVVNLLDGELKMGKTAWLRVATGSMWPTIHPGDRVLIKGIAPQELALGDLVVFKRNGELILHRLLGKEATQVLTAGDCAKIFDPLVDNEDVVGKVVTLKRHGQNVPLAGNLRSRTKALYVRTKLTARGALRWVYHRLRRLAHRDGR